MGWIWFSWIVGTIISIIVWISVIVAFVNRKKMARAAMLGMKIERVWMEGYDEREVFVTTDGEKFYEWAEGARHQETLVKVVEIKKDKQNY